MEKFEIKCSFRDFNTLCKAIPFALKQLIQNTLTYSKVSVKLPELKIGDVYIGDKKCNNKVIGNVLKYKLFSDFNTPSKLKQFENEIFKNKFCNYLKWPILPKMKDIQFRIINNVYPAAEVLRKRFCFEVDPCVFCLEEPETIEHLFFSCPVTVKFWQDLFSWLNIDINTDIPSLNMFQILVYADGLSKKMSYMLNIIITMGKYHVHKSKWNNSKPSLNYFKNECKKYLESLKHLSKDNQSLGELYKSMYESLSF